MQFQRPKWIPRWLNLPFIIFVAFILMLLFFGENNYMRINSYKQQINELIYEAKYQELHTDRETLEKIAREQYGMKRINEEVYITDIP